MIFDHKIFPSESPIFWTNITKKFPWNPTMKPSHLWFFFVCASFFFVGFSRNKKQRVACHFCILQESRLNTLDRFRKGEFRLLVATDVIGRGIDIPQVSHVIVFDMGSIDDYVHRIGRTARGKEGHGKVT